jgi:hypothetical protein
MFERYFGTRFLLPPFSFTSRTSDIIRNHNLKGVCASQRRMNAERETETFPKMDVVVFGLSFRSFYVSITELEGRR